MTLTLIVDLLCTNPYVRDKNMGCFVKLYLNKKCLPSCEPISAALRVKLSCRDEACISSDDGSL